MDDVRFCRNCGKMIQPGEKFCSGCGTPVETGSQGAYPSYSDDSRNTETATPAQYHPSTASSHSSSSNTDVAGFIFGLLSVIFGGFLFAILGLVFSYKNRTTNKYAKVGFVLSIIGMVVSVIYTILYISLLFRR